MDFRGVTDVFSIGANFLTWKSEAETGECVGMGAIYPLGGDCSHVDFRGVTDVLSAYNAFVALGISWDTRQCTGSMGVNTTLFQTDDAVWALITVLDGATTRFKA
eukprot:11461767-Heterocapsa_arctica.AAC.1